MLRVSVAAAACSAAMLALAGAAVAPERMTQEEALAALRDANERLNELYQQVEYLELDEEAIDHLVNEQATEEEEQEGAEAAMEREEPEPAQVQLLKDEGPSPVAFLNRFNFHNNVAREGNDHVAHWFIRFCYDWYAPCGMMTPVFQELASEFQKELNKGDVVQTTVRFAEVDCGVDKPLCNDQGAEYYPSVVHYTKHKPVATWQGRSDVDWNRRSLAKWLTKKSDGILEAAQIEAAKPLIPPTSLHPAHAAVAVLSFCGVLGAHLWLLAAPKTLKVGNEGAAAKHDGLKQPPVARSMVPEDWVQPVPASPVMDL